MLTAAELSAAFGNDRARFTVAWGLWLTTQAVERADERIRRQQQHIDEMCRILREVISTF